MIGSAPLRFLATIMVGWVGARAAVLWHDARPPIVAAPSAMPEWRADDAPWRPVIGTSVLLPLPAATTDPLPGADMAEQHAPELSPEPDRPELQQLMMATGGGAGRVHAASARLAEPVWTWSDGVTGRAGPTGRWSGSAWLFGRSGGSGGSLASGGLLGGSQAGARLTWRPGGPFGITGRIASPLNDPDGAEAAIGVEVTPLRTVPVRLTVERRIAIGRDGRNAWAATAAGGFWREGLPGNLVADGYGQAGIVGLRSRDLFADGAVRLARPIGESGVAVGAGIWGAAQPGVARLDIGPHVALRRPMADTNMVLAIDYRLRVAGKARPGSGIAVTLGSDF
jgi:hypothetical protein